MLLRSDMIKIIIKAIEKASYKDVHNIFWFMVGCGTIKKGEHQDISDTLKRSEDCCPCSREGGAI